MRCTILLFAQARDVVGCDRLTIELNAMATAGDALNRMVREHPALAALNDRLALAVNERYATKATPLTDGCVIALIPPVSGG